MASENDIDYSDHTRYLIKSLHNCLQTKQSIIQIEKSTSLELTEQAQKPLIQSAWHDAKNVVSHRHSSYDAFWSKKSPTIDDIDIRDIAPLAFKKRFTHRNVPCLIRGLDETNFHDLTSQWTKISDDDNNNDDENKEINLDWFLQHIPKNEHLPVKHTPSSPLFATDKINSNVLDPDGRTQEDDVLPNITFDKWLSVRHDSANYLKDWHLQQHVMTTTKKALYSTPLIFERDLLNSFLTSVTDGQKDYRFVYWGSPQSHTKWHTDVMQSLSWSFNVTGEKLWVFETNDKDKQMTQQRLELVQRKGECLFVPAGWKHEVWNKKETLSVNHNWICAASADLVLDCLLVEIQSVNEEMRQWGFDDDVIGWDEKEGMLLGGVGLSISSFFVMLVRECLIIIEKIIDSHDNQENDYDNIWENYFSLFSLEEIITLMMTKNEYDGVTNVKSISLDLRPRLTAVLRSKERTDVLIDCALFAVTMIKDMSKW